MNTYATTGLVATDPRKSVLDGVVYTSFRLASTKRTLNAKTNEWELSSTNWFTVTTKGPLAVHASESLQKGDRIVVTGEIKIRDWDNGERSGTTVEIDADSIGHDLYFGTSTFVRVGTIKPEPTPAPVHSCNCINCTNV